ncbi:hypothetical protein MTP99_012475 [Tenebrio molitor]|nr:hypothetical protein MTP99_012475 [Tenebrio molitor]
MDIDRNKYHFLTIYKKDYVEKPIHRISKNTQRQEFADPIGEGYRQYLVLDEADIPPPNEDGELYLEKFKEKYKGIARLYFQEPLHKDIIFRNKITKEKVTEYQMNYCDVEKDIQYYLERRNRKHCLDDNVSIPLTTYTTHYRNASTFLERGLERPLIIRPKDNLETHGKIVAYNISEYSDHIGRLGDLIIKANFDDRLKSVKA